MIPIDTNSRMKEIAGNLRRDVKDLLGESASIVTGFFKNGLCTVRGAATRWRNFTRDISGAFVSLFKPCPTCPRNRNPSSPSWRAPTSIFPLAPA